MPLKQARAWSPLKRTLPWARFGGEYWYMKGIVYWYIAPSLLRFPRAMSLQNLLLSSKTKMAKKRQDQGSIWIVILATQGAIFKLDFQRLQGATPTRGRQYAELPGFELIPPDLQSHIDGTLKAGAGGRGSVFVLEYWRK